VLALAACLAAACGDDDPVKATGPVTVKFAPLVFARPTGGPDTASGWVIMDDADSIRVPEDSFVNVPRGQHRFVYRLDAEYQAGLLEGLVDPQGTRIVLDLPLSASCRDIAVDGELCVPRGVPKNLLVWSKHTRPVCPANDFGEFCTLFASQRRVGAVWPDSALRGGTGNEYVSQAKLLIAATVGPELGGSGETMAMALFRAGDYSPRTRLRAVVSGADTTAYQNEVWTDARRLPLYLRPNTPPSTVLSADDRADERFGLSVKITYFLPNATASPDVRDVLFARFDVENISNHPDYRFVHADEPAGGHSLRDIYLAPTVDPNIGGTSSNIEVEDDNATAFASESLLVAYDQDFNVQGFVLPGTGTTTNQFYVQNPGLVGLRLLDGPAGTTARPFLLDYADSLSYFSEPFENQAHAALSAGRGPHAGTAGCAVRGEAYVCTRESPTDVVMGWSVGPIASLAPGERTSLTVALLFAVPKAGTFVTGTPLAPRNDLLGTAESPLLPIAENLRAVAAQARAFLLPATP
jgi:hypothetical protein